MQTRRISVTSAVALIRLVAPAACHYHSYACAEGWSGQACSGSLRKGPCPAVGTAGQVHWGMSRCAHIDEEAPLLESAPSVGGQCGRLLRLWVIWPPAGMANHHIIDSLQRGALTGDQTSDTDATLRATAQSGSGPWQALMMLRHVLGRDAQRLSVAQAEEVEVVSGVVWRVLGLERLPNQPIHHADGICLPGQNLLHRVTLRVTCTATFFWTTRPVPLPHCTGSHAGTGSLSVPYAMPAGLSTAPECSRSR